MKWIYPPYLFTEHGVTILASVLSSPAKFERETTYLFKIVLKRLDGLESGQDRNCKTKS